MELIGDERGDGVQRQRSVDRIVQNRMADPFQHDQSLLRLSLIHIYFKIFSINFNFSGPTTQWLDAMTITLFGKTFVGLSSLMGLFGPLVLMYTLLSAAVAVLIRLIVLNPLSFGLMNYMKKASTDEENANDVFRLSLIHI